MADLKPIIVVVTSIEAGKGGEGIVTVRFTNPYDDIGFHMRVPVKNLNTAMPNILKEAGINVRTFANALALAADSPLQFLQ
jgi:hypothetical protein